MTSSWLNFASNGCSFRKNFVLGLGFVCSCSADASHTNYSVTLLPLGDPVLLNSHGDVVLLSNNSNQHFIWSSSGVIRDLPVPENVRDRVILRDVNDNTQIVAVYSEVDFGPRSLVFEPDGSTRELFSPNFEFVSARFITNTGHIYGLVNSLPAQQMVWQPDTSEGIAYNNIQLFPQQPMRPLAASDSGDIAGYATDPITNSFLPSVIRDRVENLLPTGSRSAGWAQSMSESGEWIGGFTQNFVGDDGIPVRWKNDEIEELMLPEGAVDAGLLGINNKGVAAGIASANGVLQATIWDEAGVPSLVADVVRTDQNWYFETAIAINNNGQIIGNGYVETSPGQFEYRGYLLTPIPEPSFSAVLLIAGVGMRRRR